MKCTRFSKENNKCINDFIVFYYSGFDRNKFTESLYRFLFRKFRHIAEFDKGGFYHAWFEEEPTCKHCNQKLLNSHDRWILRVLTELPRENFTDIERYIVQFIESDEALHSDDKIQAVRDIPADTHEGM